MRPDAAAIPITASPPGSIPHTASTGAPKGPATRAARSSPPQAATTASTVPSPPSAIGTHTTSQPDHACRAAAATISATRADDMLPLNESLAMTMRMASPSFF